MDETTTTTTAPLTENTKKRSRSTLDDTGADDDPELEIDVNAGEPLSKRAARRLKKGRSLKQAPSSQKPLPKEFDGDDSSSDAEDDDDEDEASASVDATTHVEKVEDKKKEKKDKKDKKGSRKEKVKDGNEEEEYKKGTNGIWIGNLDFRTSEPDLVTFFSTLRPLGKSRPASAFAVIQPEDVVRVSLPLSAPESRGGRDRRGRDGAGAETAGGGKNKGFAYVDFRTAEQQVTALALSERILGSRNVLIKAADSFDGRPAVDKSTATSSGTSGTTATTDKGTKILYVGNLPFDVTQDDLATYLGSSQAGIKKVRMATFEDSGKCKGFAFVDFDAVDAVQRVLADKKLRTMNGRKLRMEFGEDRSLRRKPHAAAAPGGAAGAGGEGERSGGARMASGGRDKIVDPRRIKPGKALMDAPRASHAIVASKGEKVKFA